MNMQLVPILLCAIFCTTRNCFQEIDMTKLYNITTTVPNPTAGGTPIVRNITEKLAGLFVCFDNDEESIIIKVNNGPDDFLAQDTTITISPQDNTKPNLLTIKTYEDLRSTITINENDNGQIVIALTRSSPEGEFLLTYNGEVDVRLTSDPSTITTAQTYNFSNPLFLDQLITPVVTSTDRDNFRLNNVTVVNKLLYEFDQTFRLIRHLFERREVPKHSIYNLCSLYNAEKTRHCLAKCCEKKNVVTVNVVGDCDDFDFVDKFEVEEVCKPKVCFKEDEYSLCIINAVAVNVLFETFNFTGDCSKDALAKYAKTIIAIKSCIDVREAAVILYNAVNVFTKVGSRQREAYTSCVSSLNIDLPCLSKTYCNNNNAISSILLETETEVGLEVCDKESTKEESSEECEDEDSETSSSEKKQPTGMSNKKKLMIAGGVVVVAVVVTVSAVVFFT